ncbi:uncharacterized protein B0I36DRAFT_275155 [Microdochium trichocladiopsis]|uniref:Rhodopsin domain-containing protein n=1 Tax=Microdochium trichocladiopsis TaxID=1682393 RepID=A0A9P8XUN8_9PEZI|nr:uncharacterized protein B0I36DRAFT_275155 [Microdochium trichocladiopsis]KAH7020776.1 hypothetical protein B0I36DRAFT_275155 [Microdochium trichocladiopsis]
MPASNAPDRSVELRTVAIVLWSLAAVAMSLRIYVRTRIMKAFSIDDWFMLFAMASFTANTVTSVLGTVYGSGRHITDLVITDAMRAMMFWWACYPTFAITMIASKFSVGFFLLRITTQKVHRWIIFVAMGLSLATGLAFFFVAIFQCSPVEFAWTRFVSTNGTCLALDTIIKVTITYSTFAIITDFTFTLLPAWLVLNLHMDKKTKMAIIPILSMACIASCAVTVRLAFLNDFTSPDFLWATTDIAIWSQTEQGLAIAAGSFATLRPLFRIMMTRLGLTSGGTSGPTYGNQSAGGGGPRGAGNTGGYKIKSNSTFGGGGGGSSSKQSSKADGKHSMFSLTTFHRIDDDASDEIEKGLGSSSASTTELNSPFAQGRMRQDSDDGAVADGTGHGEYRVRVSSPPRTRGVGTDPRIPPHHDFENVYVGGRAPRGGDRY